MTSPYNASPSHRWAREQLEDDQWHDVEELQSQMVERFGITQKKARHQLSQMAKTTTVEVEYRAPNGGKRQMIHRLRRRQGARAFGNLRTCDSCGRSDLDAANRVRRDLRYYRTEGSKNFPFARGKTQYLCIPCATHEIEVTGGKLWK